MDDTVGSLEVGKQADMILVELTALNLTPILDEPIRNIVPNLVYAATGTEVDLVMVAGRILVRDSGLLNADAASVRAAAQEAAEELAAAVAHDPIHRELALLDAMDKGWL